VETPSWMQSFLRFGGPSMIFQPSGAGPWNKTYQFVYPMSWTLGNLVQFAVPTPGFVGSYVLLPTSIADFTISSTGNVSLAGHLSTSPSITLGPVTISKELWPGVTWSADVQLGGSFATRSIVPHIYTVDWSSAYATVQVSLTASLTINIFPSATPEGAFGLAAVISVTPKVALSVILGPSAPGRGDFLGGLDVLLKNLVVELDIAVSLTIRVGIDDLFEIGITGTLELNAIFQTALPHLAGLWFNASVGGYVRFLFLTISFTFWQGTIYHTSGSADPSLPLTGVTMPSLDQAWKVAPRYYNGSSYEENVWNSSTTYGTAIEDLYPQAVPAIAGSGRNALLLYASDDVAQPESQGLEVSGMELDTSSGTFSAISLPTLPGSVSFAPQVYGMPDGSVVALWTAIPDSRLTTMVPDQVTGFELMSSTQSAGRWSGPVQLQDGGYPLGYALDACGTGTPTPLAAVLVSPVLDPNAATPERLLVYDLSADALVSNVSVVGLASLTGFDCTDSWAFAQDPANTPVVVDSSTGAPVVLRYSAGAAYTWVGAVPVPGAPGTVGLLFRGPSSDELALFSPTGGRNLTALELPENTSAVRVFASGDRYSIFAGTPGGVAPYVVSSNRSEALPAWQVPFMVRFGVAPVGNGFVLFAVSSNGSSLEPIENLSLYLLGPFGPSGPGPSPATCTFGGVGCTAASEFLGGLLVALLLAGIVVFYRGRRRASGVPVTHLSPEGPHGG
jgi:hypothetical protein